MPIEIIPPTPDCEIVSSRIFNVPIQLLFNAWSNPNRLKNWWGPAGFTNTFKEFDFREGGGVFGGDGFEARAVEVAGGEFLAFFGVEMFEVTLGEGFTFVAFGDAFDDGDGRFGEDAQRGVNDFVFFGAVFLVRKIKTTLIAAAVRSRIPKVPM